MDYAGSSCGNPDNSADPSVLQHLKDYSHCGLEINVSRLRQCSFPGWLNERRRWIRSQLEDADHQPDDIRLCLHVSSNMAPRVIYLPKADPAVKVYKKAVNQQGDPMLKLQCHQRCEKSC